MLLELGEREDQEGQEQGRNKRTTNSSIKTDCIEAERGVKNRNRRDLALSKRGSCG